MNNKQFGVIVALIVLFGSGLLYESHRQTVVAESTLAAVESVYERIDTMDDTASDTRNIVNGIASKMQADPDTTPTSSW